MHGLEISLLLKRVLPVRSGVFGVEFALRVCWIKKLGSAGFGFGREFGEEEAACLDSVCRC